MREEVSFCRICTGQCGVRLTLDENDRIVKIRGDKSHPLTQGYSCAKGVYNDELHNSRERILHPMKRLENGSFEPISLAQAFDEIADKLRILIDRDGPAAISGFVGTAGYSNATAGPMLKAFMDAIGSPSRFTSLTIDQSAKIITIGRMGRWHAGRQPFDTADVWMMFGTNPLVSLSNTSGLSPAHPVKQLKAAKARGLKLVVIDPRRTETARYADIHLQPYPGEDPAIAAGLLHIILSRGWQDADFCASYVDDLKLLEEAVAPFTPDVVEARAGVPTDKLIAAAELWAGAGKRGCAASSTGPSMAPFSNLSDHLIELLNVTCGRYKRPGDDVGNSLMNLSRRAEVIPASRWWESGRKSRIEGFGTLPGLIGPEYPCGIFADDVLTPGSDQIKSLFVVGGNPAVAFPDQEKVVRALRSLDLLVTIDPFMSATAKLAHYIIPPKMQFERADAIAIAPQIDLMPYPFLQFTKEIAKPPTGAQVIDDWYLFWALAGRLGLSLNIRGQGLDEITPPTTKDLLQLLTQDRRVDFEDIWAEPQGRLFDIEQQVEPGREDNSTTFSVLPEDVARELQQYANRGASFASGPKNGKHFTHILASRRMRNVMNSVTQQSNRIRNRYRHNPAFLHPDDIAALGLSAKDRVLIRSDHGEITAIVEPDAALRPGVVQVSHCWGGLPDEVDDDAVLGANVCRLISNERDVEPINRMARMSAIPVRIQPA